MSASPSPPKVPLHGAIQVLRLVGMLLLIGVVGLGLLLFLMMNLHWATKPKDEKMDAARAAASRPVPDSAQAPAPLAR
ncbi:hypothetical protein [Hymenobacter convexus]|uniref:hypothetical protein n=1 Tax=Hymenobacter sp. CA1UV-4 TaxID=3063782 RepID=UPI0027141A96|nr:hypothetical protein [Hymenobacter sp. CA1UV-4]MDO7852046.1 hypothetical protein [Hymenobacter sp. CA1UV-4]